MTKTKKQKSRKRWTVIAQSLYAAYRHGHEEMPKWEDLTDDERQRWEDVADEAYEFYRDRRHDG